jgi:hypothetical protein
MKLFFKRCLILFFLNSGLTVFCQEDQKEWPAYYFDVLGNLKIGMLLPNSDGDNFLSDGYETNFGLHLEGKVFVHRKIALGLQYQFYKGNVTDQSLVGAFDSSIIAHGLLFGIYNFFNSKSRFALETGLGSGFIRLRNKKKGFPRFTDSGFSIAVMAEVSYRFNKSIGAYIQFQNNWSFLSIEASKEIRNDFNSTRIFSPSFGLKFYIL